MKLRTFIAIPLAAEVQERILALQNEVKKEISQGVKWVEKQSLHVTLKFLGDVEESAVSAISSCLAKMTEKLAPFSFRVQGVGVFPNKEKPHILWTGIEGAREILPSLARNLDTEMKRFGIASEEKEFSPHITIGRVKRFAEIPLASIHTFLQHKDLGLGEVQVKSILLFKSELFPEGPIYTSLSEALLKGIASK